MLLEEILLLNNIRNQMAHKLSYKEESLQLLINRTRGKMINAKLIKEDDPSFGLRNVVVFLCSCIFGITCANDSDLPPSPLRDWVERVKAKGRNR